MKLVNEEIKKVLNGHPLYSQEERGMNAEAVEKPHAFDPRGRVALTPSGEIGLTL